MKLKARISGPRVHEVGYRVFLLRRALALDVERFDAYNAQENGMQVVEVLIEGSEDQLEEFRGIVESSGPEGAEVSDVTFDKYEGRVMGVEQYMHLAHVEQLDKGIPAILKIERMQGQMLDKQDQMLDKQDQMLEKLDQTREAIVGEIRSAKDDIVGEIRSSGEAVVSEVGEMRRGLRSDLEERLMRIEGDVAQIKAKIGI
jgi:acylphosphatase